MLLSEVLMSGTSLRESIVHFKEAVMGEPSMKQRQECVNVTAYAMPFALGRVYAQHILPPGYKVSYVHCYVICTSLEDEMLHHALVDNS